MWGLGSCGKASLPRVPGAGALACDRTIQLGGPARLGCTALALARRIMEQEQVVQRVPLPLPGREHSDGLEQACRAGWVHN